MTIQDFGSIGELIAAVATVATLAYLAVQIRQNTKTVRASAHHAMIETANSIAFEFARTENAQLLLKGGRAHGDLTPEERFKYSLLMRASFGFYEEAYHQYWDGLLDRDVWESRGRTLKEVFAQPGATEWWGKNGHLYSTRFQEEIANLLAA